ncbi:cation diffusion facilitator family transporter [Deinococcus aquaticus]|uniref:Cation diffusion facilitator family transporter n=1 Tax=Deinococcus aquaticus TaxID=328692 RepID=A0ABY7UZV0_9DEIO|nr:cation diffusion facilitator family transporter [Deinococcus aquaticus]WDA58444.1 cation diffusion facilitator family transporter [Deinococcus aquaticus]
MTASSTSLQTSSRASRLALGSILVAVVVLSLKYVAYLMTGSVALYSDALESIINVAAAVAALIALRVAARPADANHPYGHTKAEYFSAVAEGVLIVLAAAAIVREALPALLNPATLPEQAGLGLAGLGVNLGAGLLNAVWASVLLRQGRALRSPALLADGRHIFSDVVTSVGVLLGVLAARLTGQAWLDPLLAILVALNILWSGWLLVRESVGGLMDAAVEPDTEAKIRQAMSLHGQGALEMHDLRTRHAGSVTFIEFHMVVPGDMTVQEAHSICDRLEDAIRAETPQSSISIHVEPQEKAKHHGVLVL